MAAAWKAAVVALDVLAAPTVSASLVVTSPQGEMVDAPVVTAVGSTSTSHATSVDPAVMSELVLLSVVAVLLSVAAVADVQVAVMLVLELLTELVVLARVAVVELVAISVVELLVKLVAQELVVLVLAPVVEKVTGAPVPPTVVITAATGSSLASRRLL